MTDPLATLSPAGIRTARAVIADPDRHPAELRQRAAHYILRWDCDPEQIRRAGAVLSPPPRRVTRLPRAASDPQAGFRPGP